MEEMPRIPVYLERDNNKKKKPTGIILRVMRLTNELNYD